MTAKVTSLQFSSDLMVWCSWHTACGWHARVGSYAEAQVLSTEHLDLHQRRVTAERWKVGDQCTVRNSSHVWTIVGFFADGRIADLQRPGWTAKTSAYRHELRPVPEAVAS